MSELVKPRPRIDLFPGQNRISPQELIDHPERAEHFEYLIDRDLQLAHGSSRCGIGITPTSDQVWIKGKLVPGGLEIRGVLAFGSHLSLTDIDDPEIGRKPNERPPLKFPGRFTLVIRND